MPGLHHELCTNRNKDVKRMMKLLRKYDEPYAYETALRRAVVHAVGDGHDVCLNFLYSIGATGYVHSELIQLSVLKCHPVMFGILLEKGCTQDVINYILQFIGCPNDLFFDDELEFVKIIIKHGFNVQFFDLLFDRRYSSLYQDDFTPLPNKFVFYSEGLKFLLMSGGVVDYRQLPYYENLTEQNKDQVSLIQHFVKVSTEEPSDMYDVDRKGMSESLQILRQCGANFSEIDADGKSLLDLIQEKRAELVEESYYEEVIEYCDELSNKIQQYSSELLNLQSLSRLSLIRHLKSRYLECVDKLSPSQYPRDVINFLKGDDMKVTGVYLTPEDKERSVLRVKFRQYKRLLEKYLINDVLPLKMKNKLRSKLVTHYKFDETNDVLKEKIAEMGLSGHTIMKYEYKI